MTGTATTTTTMMIRITPLRTRWKIDDGDGAVGDRRGHVAGREAAADR